jgi:hypothetical protein
MKPSWILKIFIIIMSTSFSPEEAAAQNQKGKMYFSSQPFNNGHENSKNSFTSVSLEEEFNTGFKAGFFLPYADNSDYYWKKVTTKWSFPFT